MKLVNSPNRRIFGLTLIGLNLSLAACTSTNFKNNNLETMQTAGPWRTSTQDGEANVMLEGHDAVAYFKQNKAVRGDRAHSVELHGVKWRFINAESKAEFVRNPAAYIPQFGGYCTNGIAYAIPAGGSGAENSWRIYRGRLYIFSGARSRDFFELDTQRNLDFAHQYWVSDVAGNDANATVARKVANKVPNYKTTAELESEYRTKLAAKTLPVMPGGNQIIPR